MQPVTVRIQSDATNFELPNKIRNTEWILGEVDI